MTDVKQVIVVRKDLNMRKGKIAAQSAHASMAVLLNRGGFTDSRNYNIPLTPEMNQWITGRFTKVCVSVDSEAELLEIFDKANAANLPCSLITDAGLTEFGGVPTRTTVAIGPAKSQDIDHITSELKLL